MQLALLREWKFMNPQVEIHGLRGAVYSLGATIVPVKLLENGMITQLISLSGRFWSMMVNYSLGLKMELPAMMRLMVNGLAHGLQEVECLLRQKKL